MKTILLVCGLCLVVCGCRGGGGNELLERELRLQEDRLFQLQDALDQCQAMLDASRRENEAIKKEIIGGDRGAAPESGMPAGIADPTIEIPGVEKEPASRLAPPKRGGSSRRKPESELEIVPGIEVEVDPGMPADPDEVPASEEDEAPRKRTSGRGASSAVTDRRVVKLALNKQLTGGLSHDGHTGDEGIMVVFEPRNTAGQFVNEPADVSIVVIDPAVSGPAARVARWDYTSDEVSQHFRKTALGPGLYFELPWPSQPPKHKKVQLFVRYTTTDGRKITADQPINIDSNDRHVKNWKQSAANGKPPASSRNAKNGAAKANTAKNGAAAGGTMKRREPQFLTSKNPGSDLPGVKSKSNKAQSTWEKASEPRGMSKATIAASEPGDVIRIPDGPNDPDIRAAAEVRALAEAQAGGTSPVELARDPRAERKPEAVSERPVWKPYR